MALKSMKFRDLTVGQSFDFINDDNPMMTSFWARCEKTGARTYRSLSTNFKYKVGSIDATVYHPGLPMPRPGICQWFALCTNPSVKTVPHPILGAVAICRRCADKHDL